MTGNLTGTTTHDTSSSPSESSSHAPFRSGIAKSSLPDSSIGWRIGVLGVHANPPSTRDSASYPVWGSGNQISTQSHSGSAVRLLVGDRSSSIGRDRLVARSLLQSDIGSLRYCNIGDYSPCESSSVSVYCTGIRFVWLQSTSLSQ